jgi:predicted ATPase
VSELECAGYQPRAAGRRRRGFLAGALARRAAANPTFEDARAAAAVQLFAQRALAADPAFTLTERNARPVVEVCRRMDGLPLALELAAAAVPTLGVSRLASRLATRIDLLTGGPSSEARHQTLDAALSWSHDLLSVPEQVMLRRLSVFARGWTLDAAETVCADDALDANDVVVLRARPVARRRLSWAPSVRS